MNETARMGQLWWQAGVILQVYPRSFQDSDGDGVGDLAGITRRLPYLRALGVDAVWLSPIYPSPMADFGYDVADYTDVDPLFGSLADFDALISAAHALGLRVILDFVPNHSSDQHPWFVESRSSRTSAKRDWYLWRDSGPGSAPGAPQPPNNWMSHFGGPSWSFDRATEQWYCHSFLPEQPDLNWRNAAVKEAMFAAMRFWLDRGVDGFRMDVLWLLVKDDQFRDDPPNPSWRPGDNTAGKVIPVYNSNLPETHTIVAEMRSLMDEYPERLLIGEIYLPLEELVTYYGASPLAADRNETAGTAGKAAPGGAPVLRGANMPFNFHLILSPWQAGTIAALVRRYEALLPPGAWPNYVLGNHDQSRLATRIGHAQARVAALILLTLRGTPTLYYGDELGMPDTPIPADMVQDPAEKRQPGIGAGRDPERTPMLWDRTAEAGFTTGRPWLPIAAGTPESLSVEVEGSDPRSSLSLYRALLHLRRQWAALHAGAIGEVRDEDGVLRYERLCPMDVVRTGLAGTETAGTDEPRHLLVLANLLGEPRTTEVPRCRVVLTTLLDGSGAEVEGTFHLEPDEAVLLEVL